MWSLTKSVIKLLFYFSVIEQHHLVVILKSTGMNYTVHGSSGSEGGAHYSLIAGMELVQSCAKCSGVLGSKLGASVALSMAALLCV